jgi:beta-lactamase class A
MRLLGILSLAILVALGAPRGAAAQSADTKATILTALFSAKSVDAGAFDASFTAQVPPATLQSIVDDFRMRLGKLTSVRPQGSDYALTFERGGLIATIGLDAAGKVSSLLLHDETSEADRKALERFFTERPVQPGWFSAAFLAAVPIEQIRSILDQLTAQEGAFERVEVRDGAYYAIFAKAENHVLVALDADGKFTTLRLLPPVARASNLDDALAKLAAANGPVSYLVRRAGADGEDVAAAGADRPLAVGSSFKLVVLAALRAQIDAKARSWSDVVPLPASAKSLPSGTFQTWPAGTPITLATYAAQMISISDNTAADVLAGLVGRPALEALSPRNTPFLTTRELFALKSRYGAPLRSAYRAGDAAARRTILAKLDAGALPGLADLDLSPADLDIEWFLTNRELCGFMERVADLDLMTINPGVPVSGWKRIAYKGGSDAGVLNLTSYVTAPDGTSYCVSATWNDRARSPDEAACTAAFGAVLQQLARR